MNKYIKCARQMHSQLNGLTADFTDEQALANKELYPNRNGNGVYLAAGTVVYYDERLYRVIQPHATQFDWTPDKVPALFVKISLEEWPQWEQPAGAHDAYMRGAKVSDEGKHWISNKDYNIYKPGLVPGDWSEVA